MKLLIKLFVNDTISCSNKVKHTWVA